MSWIKQLAESEFYFIEGKIIHQTEQVSFRLTDEQFDYFKDCLENFVLKNYKDEIIQELKDHFNNNYGNTCTLDIERAQFEVTGRFYIAQKGRWATHTQPEEPAIWDIDYNTTDIKLI